MTKKQEADIAKMKIRQTGEDSWEVESPSGNTYTVWDNGPEDAEYGGGVHCNCLAAKYGRYCKHIEAALRYGDHPEDYEDGD